MRRDADLNRALLLKLEELPTHVLISPDEPDSVPAEGAVPGCSWDEIEYPGEAVRPLAIRTRTT